MRPLPLFAIFLTVATGILGVGWLNQPQTSGELVGHAAKLSYFFGLVLEHQRIPAWLPDYLTGHPAATLLSFALAFPVYLPGILLFGTVAGMKVTGLLLLASGGLAAFLLGRRLTGNGWTAFAIGAAYYLSPQLLLRLGWQEHMTIVVTYPLVPLAFWSLLRVFERGTPFDSILFSAIFSATLLAWSKMGATLVIPLAIFSLWLFATRPDSRSRCLRALAWILPAVLVLGVFPLLPLLREHAHMAVFEFEPFDAWQAQYALKTATSFVDRGGNLFRSLPAIFGIDRGGYYLGLLSLATVIAFVALHWTNIRNPKSEIRNFQLFLTVFLSIFWISFGPRTVWGGNSDFLASAMRLNDLVIPVHWLLFAAPLAAIWWLCRSTTRYAHVLFAVLALIFLFVPGFRLLEFLPVYQDLRAPDSFWILNATLAWAVCVGIAVTDLLSRIDRPALRVAAAGAALALLAFDQSIYARWFFRSDLSPTALANYKSASAELANGTGRVYPISGRYFLLDLPLRSGRPLSTEALNRYLMPRYASRLQVASRVSAPALLAYSRTIGVTDFLLDKTDPAIATTYKEWIRNVLPVTYENEDFAILRNEGSLHPAFHGDSTAPTAADLTETTDALTFINQDTIAVSGLESATPTSTSLTTQPVESPNTDTRQLTLPGTDTWIVLSEAWHPDWTATLDEEPAAVHRAAGALPAVHVTAENTSLTFQFRPPVWYP
ncbi:MAG: hypothetical protein WA771_07290, partial [Chthoniobacterales bacterium]